jgi:hypothetical protein
LHIVIQHEARGMALPAGGSIGSIAHGRPTVRTTPAQRFQCHRDMHAGILQRLWQIFYSLEDAFTNLVATEAGAQAGMTLSDALATLF